MMIACSLCVTDDKLEPGLARGNAGLWVNQDTQVYMCLGHASYVRCECGWQIISCSIAGCGTWKPINDRVDFLGNYIWDLTHEEVDDEEDGFLDQEKEP